MSIVASSTTTLVALKALNTANSDIGRSSERLATGQKVNRAGDDPAGIGKANLLKAELGSYSQVKRNISDASGNMERVGSALNTMSNYLIEMRSIAMAAASASAADTGLVTAYQESFDQLGDAMDQITNNLKISDSVVLDGTFSKDFQVGIYDGDVKTVEFGDVTATTLGVARGDVTLASGDTSMLATIDDAINTVALELAKVGGYQNSFVASDEMADSNILSKTAEYKTIMDADLALEATNLAAARIRQDASTAVLAQANSMNRTITDYLLNGALA
jgi:flagellin